MSSVSIGRQCPQNSKNPRYPAGLSNRGIAVVLPDALREDGDSVDQHVADTLAAGAGLCDPNAVRSIVADGYRAVAELVDAFRLRHGKL